MCYPNIIRRNRVGQDVDFGQLSRYSIPGLENVIVLANRLHGIRILGLDDQGLCGDTEFLTDLYLEVHTPVSMGVRITTVYVQDKEQLAAIAEALSARPGGQVVKAIGMSRILAVWGNGSLICGPTKIDEYYSNTNQEDLDYFTFDV